MAEAPAPPASTPAEEDDYIVNERDINYYWKEYARQMPQEQIAMARRMQAMHVGLLNENTFEAVVDNDIIAKEFTSLAPSIQEYLRAKLKNRHITMNVRIAAPAEKKQAYGRKEKFQMMAQKNSALMELKERFGLEFY